MAAAAPDAPGAQGKYESLNVDYANYKKIISEKILPRFGKHTKNVKLEGMDLRKGKDQSEFIALLIKYCPNMTHFQMYECDIDISLFDDLHRWPNLEFLDFTIYSNVASKPRGTKRKLGNDSPLIAKNVKTLKLCYMVNKPNELALSVQFRARLFSYCPNLTHFELSSWKEDTSLYKDLPLLSNLKFLRIDGVDVKKRRGDGDTAFTLPFEKLKNLETVILADVFFDMYCLYDMIECKNLVSINIRRLDINVSEDFIDSLVKTKQETLRELHIKNENTTVNDELVGKLSTCSQLQVLYLRTDAILSDSSLLNLSKLKNLQTLELLMCGNFSESAMLAFLTNDNFQQMTNLRVPGGLKFTPEIIETIKTKMPKLKELTVGGETHIKK